MSNSVELSDKTRVRTNATVLLSIIAACVAGALALASAREDIRSNTKSIEDHEHRLRSVESEAKDLAVMRNDIKWIRDTMQKHYGP